MLVPSKNSPDKDRVYTPEELAIKIINSVSLYGKVLDPCMGEGSFYNNINHDKDWCELDKGKDFLLYTNRVDWVITNPPWSKFREFLIHAMSISDNIAFLAPINHFITKARLRDISSKGFYINKFILVDTPKEFPQSGFQLVVGVLSKTKSDTAWSKL